MSDDLVRRLRSVSVCDPWCDERRKQLEALRDRLAKATGPDRELDEALRVLAGHDKEHMGSADFLVSDAEDYEPAHYTASLDAAVTLVPEKMALDLHDWTWAEEPCWCAALQRAWGPCDRPDHISAKAATGPLALCLARIEYELSKDDPANV